MKRSYIKLGWKKYRVSSASLVYQRIPNGELLVSLDVRAGLWRVQDGERLEEPCHLSLEGLALGGQSPADLVGQSRSFSAPPPEPLDVPNTNCYTGWHMTVVDNRVRVLDHIGDRIALEWAGKTEEAMWAGHSKFVLRALCDVEEIDFRTIAIASVAEWSTDGPGADELARLGERFARELDQDLREQDWFRERDFVSVSIALQVEDEPAAPFDFDDGPTGYRNQAFRLRLSGRELRDGLSDDARVALMKRRAGDALAVLARGERPAPLEPEQIRDRLPPAALARFRDWFDRVPTETDCDREWCREASANLTRGGLELHWWSTAVSVEIARQLDAGAMSKACHRGIELILLACADSPAETYSTRAPEVVRSVSKGDWAATGVDEIVELGLSPSAEAQRWGDELGRVLQLVRDEEQEASGQLRELERRVRAEPASPHGERALALMQQLSRLIERPAEPSILT